MSTRLSLSTWKLAPVLLGLGLLCCQVHAGQVTVDSVTPSSGSTNGGTSVTITGTNFSTTGTTVVRFGGLTGAQATNVAVTSDTSLTATTPPQSTAGAVDVVVVTGGRTGTGTALFSYVDAAAPTFASIAPANGPTTGGTSVTIFGTGFATGAAVTFDANPATNVSVTNDTTIAATTPAHSAPGAVNVVVTNPDTKAVTGTGAFTYDQAAAPTVTGVSPVSGSVDGGTSVTITGTGFAAGATVSFGGTAATGVTVTDDKTITAPTPAHAAGKVDVVVTNADSQAGTFTQGYEYTAGGGGSTPGFRFLTTVLPDVSTNAVYSATLLTANANGAVTYRITASNLPTANGLYTGMTFDPATGFITGRPENVGGESPQAQITFEAQDSAGATITITLSLKRSSTGGGGNAGIGFPLTLTLNPPAATAGQPYTKDLACEFGVGPFIFSALDLPPGITLSGLEDKDRNFTITGTPTAAGTFYVTLSVTDIGEGNNKVITILPLVVLPANSQFQFTTTVLDNGEVGLPYEHAITTSGAAGTVTYGASGLPLGLAMDPASGVITGPPTQPGTYYCVISASDGTSTITMNRSIIIAPAAPSVFHWTFSGLPSGTLNVDYSRQPPIAVVAEGATSITYSAAGLPEGLIYSIDGVLSGTPTDIGIFPVTFTATDASSTIIMHYDMVVFPPNGGDLNSLPVNLWVKKGQIKTGTDGKESWQMQYIYNANRTAAKVFNPAADAFIDKLGGIAELNLTPPPTLLTGKKPKYAWKSAKGVNPARALKLDMSGQTIAVTSKNDTIPDTVPSPVVNRVTLGRKGYKLDLFFDAKGKFTPALGYLKTAFVVASAKVSVKAATKDSAAFSMLLGDPSFKFPADSGNKTVKFRVINSNNQDLITVAGQPGKHFTDIVTAKPASATAPNGSTVTVYKMKSGKDTVTPAGKYMYDSKSGKLTVALKGLSLAGLLTGSEAHVSVEMTIAEKQYYTGVTLFAPKAGSYSTKMPP